MKEEQKIWREFYEAAIDFRDLKPWKWMYDTEVFGVEDPESGQINYCCIMGNAGQVFALGIYPGTEGFKTYLALSEMPEDLPLPDSIALGLDQKMFKVEFVSRDELDKQDLDRIKSLGLKFRGKNQWVMPKEHRPGFFPWHIPVERLPMITTVLRQAIDVAKRYVDDEDLLYPEDELMLIRTPKNRGGELVWEDEYKQNEMLTIQPFPSRKPSPGRVKKAEQELSTIEGAILYSLQYHRSPIWDEEKYDRPYFSKIAFFINYSDGMILGFDLIAPESPLDKIEESIFKQLHAMGGIPQQIGVNSVMAFRAVAPIAEALGIELLFIPEEPLFDEVIKHFERSS